jgi:hypothetical protein
MCHRLRHTRRCSGGATPQPEPLRRQCDDRYAGKDQDDAEKAQGAEALAEDERGETKPLEEIL